MGIHRVYMRVHRCSLCIYHEVYNRSYHLIRNSPQNLKRAVANQGLGRDGAVRWTMSGVFILNRGASSVDICKTAMIK
jgi:hypothetical protein